MLRDAINWCFFHSSVRPQGEILSLRLPADKDLENLDSEYGLLMFDDGGQKGLAAAIVWIGCIYLLASETADNLRHPRMTSLVMSLLQIPSLHKSQAPDEVSGMLQRIIKQNVDAKTLPVSSFEWAGILQRLGPDTISLSDAIQKYNNNPEVCAHGSFEPCQGSGELSLLFSFPLFVATVFFLLIALAHGLRSRQTDLAVEAS